MLHAVGCCDLSYRTAGITISKAACRDILCDHTSGSDDGPVPDSHPAYDHRVAGDPDVIAYMYVLCILRHGGAALGIKPHTLRSDQRMICSHKGNVGPEADIISYIDPGVVHDCKVKVCKEILSYKCMDAVIKLYRPLKVKHPACAAKYPTYQLISLRIILIHGVIFLTRQMSPVLDILQLLLSRIKHLTGKYLILFPHVMRLRNLSSMQFIIPPFQAYPQNRCFLQAVFLQNRCFYKSLSKKDM